MRSQNLGFLLVALLLVAGCREQPSSAGKAKTLSSFDVTERGDTPKAAQAIRFEQADLEPVLKLYAEVSGRSVIRGTNLPEVKVTFCNQSPMSAVEVLQALDTMLAAQGVVMIAQGTQYMKAVTTKDAVQEPAPVIDLQPEQLPDSSSFMTYITRTRHVQAGDAAKALQLMAKMPNAIMAINGGGMKGRPPTQTNVPLFPTGLLGPKDNNVLVLRDYSLNVKRMLKVLEQVDQ